MKKFTTYNTIISVALVSLSALLLTSCEKYLDVRPKSEIPVGLHFDRESGFQDQLTGVYTKMCGTSMYGREMTFGLMEVLSQNYDLNSNSLYFYASQYNYEVTTIKSKIDDIWSNTYNCIANLNVMIDYLDKADPKIFTDNNYSVFKGEAIGLRAFLHFDMLRIFAPSFASNPAAPAIPYVTKYEPKITPQSTVSEALDLIISDLEKAVTLLKKDTLFTAQSPYYVTSRRMYFNYFAAEATLARAYLYKGDKVNALKYANEIITNSELTANSALNWTHYTALETTYEYECNRTYTDEQVFQLKINDLEDIVKYYFTSTAGNNALSPSDTKADVIFEKSSKGYGNDYRMNLCFKYDGAKKYLSKFWQYENDIYNYFFPIIRKTEAYYIAAEILKDSNPTRAIELLNIVRSHRKLSAYALPNTLTASEIQNEIFKEYRKEFLAEGQLFYYYKRLNLPKIEGAGVAANDNIYVLPMPDNEIEFGKRN